MEIDFIPIAIVQVWRVVVWCAALGLLGSVVAFLPRAWTARHNGELMERWTLDLYVGVAFVIFQIIVVQGINWTSPLRLQGLPVTTIIIAWFISARVRRARAGIS